jgi:hypothetical protein
MFFCMGIIEWILLVGNGRSSKEEGASRPDCCRHSAETAGPHVGEPKKVPLEGAQVHLISETSKILI